MKRILLAGALLLGACSARTPAPRFSTPSPDDPSASEAEAPSIPTLSAEEGEPSPGPPPSHEGHEHHAAGESAVSYTCPMHPEVESKEPGKCPICGMTLVEKSKP